MALSEMELEIQDALHSRLGITDADKGAEHQEPAEPAEEPEETAQGDVEEETAQKQEPAVEPPPASLSAKIKEKWATLDPEVRSEWQKREADVHKMFTSRDGELNIGRKIKEVVSPYMADIQAEGGTVDGVVSNLLQTAHTLRHASPQQKAALVQNIIQSYGVDMSVLGNQQGHGVDELGMLRQEIARLKEIANPDSIIKQMTERQEHANIQNEVKAFASDPANVHFEKVKDNMSRLFTAGFEGDLKEAYDLACMAHPEVRALVQQPQSEATVAKRKTDVAAKLKAGSSITGSSGTSTSSNSKDLPLESMREFLRQQLEGGF